MPPVDSNKRLARMLAKAGLITEEQERAALELCEEDGEIHAIQALARLGVGDEATLADRLASLINIPRLPEGFSPEPKAFSFFPPGWGEQRGCVALQYFGATLLVAVVDPLDIRVYDDIRFLTGYNPELVLATPAELERLRAAVPDKPLAWLDASYIDYIAQKVEAAEQLLGSSAATYAGQAADGDAEMQFRNRCCLMEEEGPQETETIVSLTYGIFLGVVTRDASALRLVVDDHESALHYLVGGQWQEVFRRSPILGAPLIWRLKAMMSFPAGPLSEPSSGRLQLRYESVGLCAFCVEFQPVERGVSAVAHLVPYAYFVESEPPPPYDASLDAAERTSRLDVKLAKLREARQWAERSGAHSAVAMTMHLEAVALASAGRVADARSCLAQALAQLEDSSPRSMIARFELLVAIADLACDDDDLDSAAVFVDRARALAIEARGGAAFQSTRLDRVAALVSFERGEAARARDALDDAVEALRQLHGRPTLDEAWLLLYRGHLAAAEGSAQAPDVAQRALDLIERIAPAPPFNWLHVNARVRLAEILRRAGRIDEALKHAREAKKLIAEVTGYGCFNHPDEVLALLFAERGSIEAAEASLESYRSLVQAEFRHPAPVERLDFVTARVAEAQGRTDEARELYRGIRSAWRRQEARERLERLGSD